MAATSYGVTPTRVAAPTPIEQTMPYTMPCGTIFGVEIGGGTDAGASGTIGRAVSETRVEWSMSAVKRIVTEAAVALPLPLPLPCLLHCR